MKWKPWSEQSLVIPLLGLLVMVLAVAAAFKMGVFSVAWLSENKDAIGAAGTIVSTILFALAGFLAYVRFFRGRTLSPKLTIELTSGAAQAPDGTSVMHWIDVEVKNAGAVAIWGYTVTMKARLHGPTPAEHTVDNFMVPAERQGTEFLLDVGESVYEHGILTVPPEITAVTFRVTVYSQENITWERSLTARNTIEQPKKS